MEASILQISFADVRGIASSVMSSFGCDSIIIGSTCDPQRVLIALCGWTVVRMY